MNKLVVLIKFNRTDLHETGTYPTGMRFNKTLGKKEWWGKRLKILKEIVFPSLENQTFQDFDIVAPFTTDIPKGYADEVIEFLKSKSVHVCWDDRKIRDFVEPVDKLRELYHGKVKNIILVNLDSDDVYHKTAFEKLLQVPSVVGQVYIFRNGFVYDIPTKRLALYEGRPSPPPFFAMTFTNDALESQENWDEYVKYYNLQAEHPHLKRCLVKKEMPDGLFCYVFHEYNVTSSWDNPHHKKKIKELVTGEAKNKVLKGMGLREL
jgi:hypothetical protein